MYERYFTEIPRNITGIYKITNKKTGMIYIGQAIDIRRRWNAHISLSKRIALLQKNDLKDYQPIDVSLSKHDINDYNWEIIEKCTLEELNKKEIYWINYYDSYNHGYNATLGGQGRKERPNYVDLIIKDLINTNDTFDTISKKYNINSQIVSNINRGLTYYNEEFDYPIRKYTKSVIQYDLKGNQIKIYNTVTDAANSVGASTTQISSVCNGHSLSCKNYIWRYENDPLIQIPHTKSSRKTILQIDSEGKIVGRYISGPEAEKQTGFNRKCITNVCSDTTGRHKTYKGYYWRYEEN